MQPQERRKTLAESGGALVIGRGRHGPGLDAGGDAQERGVASPGAVGGVGGDAGGLVGAQPAGGAAGGEGDVQRGGGGAVQRGAGRLLVEGRQEVLHLFQPPRAHWMVYHPTGASGNPRQSIAKCATPVMSAYEWAETSAKAVADSGDMEGPL